MMYHKFVEDKKDEDLVEQVIGRYGMEHLIEVSNLIELEKQLLK